MFSACRNCPRSAIQAQEEVLDPCCKPYAQPSPTLAFFTGSKKATHYKVIRWMLSLAVEGSQSSLTSVWTSLASCKSLSLVNLLRPLHWFLFLRAIHIQLKPLKRSPVMDAWLDKVRHQEIVFKKSLTLFITIHLQCKNMIHLPTLSWNNILNLTFFLVIKQIVNSRSYWETNNGRCLFA